MYLTAKDQEAVKYHQKENGKFNGNMWVIEECDKSTEREWMRFKATCNKINLNNIILNEKGKNT